MARYFWVKESVAVSSRPKFSTVVEEQAGCGRGIVKGQAEGVEETAKRFKALERTREAGTAQDYGSVVPGLILGFRNQTMNRWYPGLILAARNITITLAPTGSRIRNALRGYFLA